jgi:DNA polymerase III gamma/tau subunit
LADGRPGWALRALRDPSLLQERQEQLSVLSQALPKDRARRFDLADRLAKNNEALPDLLRTWLTWWRDLTLIAWGNPEQEILVNADRLPELQALAQAWKPQNISASLARTGEAIWQLEHNANARLVIENLLLHYPLLQEKQAGEHL